MFNKLIVALREGYRLLAIGQFVYFFANLFGKVDRQTVRIDGGLGAQIIGYMQYKFAKSENPDASCDISFFKLSKSHPMFKSDVTFRNWHLDYYGITIDQLLEEGTTNRNYWVKSNLKDKGKQFKQFFESGIHSYNWGSLFPISNNTLLSLQEFEIDSESTYAAIHIRRGDFLKFASLVVDDDSVLRLLSVTKYLFPRKVFIVSDDDFDPSLKTKIGEILTNNDVHYTNGGEELVIHGLLRNAQVLITSNSMFSLSAAILQRPGGVSMLPKYFFGEDFKFHNAAVGSLSNWMIFSERPEIKL